MNQYQISYPKHNIDVFPFKYNFYVNIIFTHDDKSYLVTKIVYEKNLVQDFRLLCDLQNKNSELYSELILAINKLNTGRYIHIISKSMSSKILSKVNFNSRRRIRVVLYPNGGIRYLNSKKELIPIISIYF